MPPTSATNRQLILFKEKAEKVGFSPEGLFDMLNMLKLRQETLTSEDIRNLWPYLNEINARKFSYGRPEVKENRKSVEKGKEKS